MRAKKKGRSKHKALRETKSELNKKLGSQPIITEILEGKVVKIMKERMVGLVKSTLLNESNLLEYKGTKFGMVWRTQARTIHRGQENYVTKKLISTIVSFEHPQSQTYFKKLQTKVNLWDESIAYFKTYSDSHSHGTMFLNIYTSTDSIGCWPKPTRSFDNLQK